MTKQEANDFIALNYNAYINKLVFFETAGVTALIKAINVIEGDGGEFTATCYFENPNEEDASFEDHIFSHMSLQDVIALGKLV